MRAAVEVALTSGLAGPDALSALGCPGAQLALQRAVENEAAAFLHRAHYYERTPDAAGWRSDLAVAVPQVRDTLTRFVSGVIPDTRATIRTRPLEALVIGAYIRDLSERDVESLGHPGGGAQLGQMSKTVVSGICRELRDRCRAFRARSSRGSAS